MTAAVLALTAIGGSAVYIYKVNSENSSSSVSEIATKVYTDTAKIYQLVYPEQYVLQKADNCCEGAPKDFTKISQTVTFYGRGSEELGQGLNVQADTTGELAQIIRANWSDNKHTPQIETIHGARVEHVTVTFKGDAEQYVDHNYLFSKGSSVVYVTYREYYNHTTTNTKWTNASQLVNFQSIIQSITIL